MLKAIIFDVDGTLIDSVDAHAASWHDAFVEFGVVVDKKAIRSQIGKGGDQLMPVFLTSAFLDKNGDAIERRRAQILKERYRASIKAFPQVRALFERLKHDKVRVELASSAKGPELDHYKQLAQIEDLVQAETSSDDADRSKPHPDIFETAVARLKGIDKGEMVVVGDTPYDAEAAGKAGLRTIGVLCGGFAEEDLRRAGCSNIFRDPADILAHYEELLPTS